jgi:hypothetical protein
MKRANAKKNWMPAVAGMTMLLALLAGLWGARVLADEAAKQDAAPQPSQQQAQDKFDFFSDQPVTQGVVELPPEKSAWLTVGGPLALIGFFFFQMAFYWWMVPFQLSEVDINLHQFPAGVQRGIALAIGLFGIAFCFGASEIWYQLRLHGSAEAYFAQMTLGKLIAFTHAHLFGFTTSFFIIGIPFSMQFNQVWQYQWIFPIGLSAALTDVISWWGIKYVAPSFEWVSMLCGVLFAASYLYMLVALERVLLFPDFIWVTDKDREQRLQKKREQEDAARYQEGDV